MDELETFIVGIFPSRLKVAEVIWRLKKNHFSIAEVSVLFFNHQQEDPQALPEFQQFDGIAQGPDFAGALGWLTNAGSYQFRGASILVTGPLAERLRSQDQGQKIQDLAKPFLGLGFLKKESQKIELRIQNEDIPVLVRAHSPRHSARLQELFKACGADEVLSSSYPSLKIRSSMIPDKNLNF